MSDSNRKIDLWKKRNLPTFNINWLHFDQPDTFLVDIDLSHNSFYNVDGMLIWGLPKLEVLNMSYCHLLQIPSKKENHDISALR